MVTACLRGLGRVCDTCFMGESTRRAEKPSGTVTFLFTDIEGSTRRWAADPDAMSADLAAHDEVLRAAVEGQGGWLFKHTGDGVCAAFGSPRAAVDAAVGAQRLLGLPVRMGLATGEAELRGDDYFGSTLNTAARVMDAGHGGQVLVASSTAGLVSGIDLVDLGLRSLRDLMGPVQIFQLRAEGLQAEFPAIAGDMTRFAVAALLRRGAPKSYASDTQPGLSPRTVRYIHTILHAALKDALRWNRVVRNVADAATPP